MFTEDSYIDTNFNTLLMLNCAIVITMFVKDRILSYNHSGLHYYRYLLMMMILNHAIVITMFVKDRILSYNHSGLHYHRFLPMTITSFCLRKRDFFHLCATHFGNIFNVLMFLSTCSARIYLHFFTLFPVCNFKMYVSHSLIYICVCLDFIFEIYFF